MRISSNWCYFTILILLCLYSLIEFDAVVWDPTAGSVFVGSVWFACGPSLSASAIVWLCENFFLNDDMRLI